MLILLSDDYFLIPCDSYLNGDPNGDDNRFGYLQVILAIFDLEIFLCLFRSSHQRFP